MRLLSFASMSHGACIALGLMVSGCGASNDAIAPGGGPSVGGDAATGERAAAHDPHDVPITEADVVRPADYADAVARIKGYRDTIRTETTTGTPSHAHRSLDELDYVLDWLPEIARDSEVPKEDWADLNKSAQQLRDLFNQVHANIDAGTAPDYAAVADAIEVEIGRLETFHGSATE
jgi:hypothetical protein